MNLCGMKDDQRNRKEEAQVFANKQGSTGDVWFVDDRWGGYWQTPTKYGPYTFRLPREKSSS